MSDHLNIERISALLDEPERDPAGGRHLASCEACQAEHERLGRMRMALSGLPELDPPAGEWERVVARLDAGAAARGWRPASGEGRGGARTAASGRWGARGLPRWPLQLAAAVILFGGGIVAGLRLTAGDGPGGTSVSEPRASDGEAAAGFAFEELERPLPLAHLGDESGMDPVAAAQRLARLDALIVASQEAVTEAPADPVANELLFELVEQRDMLAGRLQQTLHLATLEVR